MSLKDFTVHNHFKSHSKTLQGDIFACLELFFHPIVVPRHCYYYFFFSPKELLTPLITVCDTNTGKSSSHAVYVCFVEQTTSSPPFPFGGIFPASLVVPQLPPASCRGVKLSVYSRPLRSPLHYSPFCTATTPLGSRAHFCPGIHAGFIRPRD